MISRDATTVLRGLFEQYPVVTLTGPRQAGKTTLCRQTFAELPNVNLEAVDIREFATEDPRGFLARFPDGAVLDEVQRAPDLLSYIQVIVDERQHNGLFVLTGSRQLLIDERVSQSLAGRTGLMTLLPLTISEVHEFDVTPATDELIYTGFYPRIYDHGIEPTRALGDYFATYVERDVRQLSEIRDLSLFRRFVKLCAGRCGQLLNYQNLANDAGISHATAREWISILEASYIVFLLPPHHANIRKRLTKSPKLYFHDVGLASYLLGIDKATQVSTHPLRGALFENLVIAEALKQRFNAGRQSNLEFYRDSSGLEVDAIASRGEGLVGIEIKAGATLQSDHLAGLKKIVDILPQPFVGRILVHDGADNYRREGIAVTTPAGLAGVLRDVDDA